MAVNNRVFLRNSPWQGMVVYAFQPREKPVNSHEFKASLLYKASSSEPGVHSKSLSQETKLNIALSSS